MDTELTTVYYRSCSGITGWWLLPDEATELFAQKACEGTLEEGFAYYGATSDGADLVGTVVTPHPIDSVPAEERAKLQARLAQVAAA